MSRKKPALSADAISRASGGASRVFTSPGRGAFAMTAMAQPPSGSTTSGVTTR
jgi:hypothetical protein